MGGAPPRSWPCGPARASVGSSTRPSATPPSWSSRSPPCTRACTTWWRPPLRGRSSGTSCSCSARRC